MTYKELLAELQKLNEEQLDQDVCIWDTEGPDEYYQESVGFMFTSRGFDVDHPIIRF